MSTDFEVYPCTEINFSFGDLLAEFKKNIKNFLKKMIYILTLMFLQEFITAKRNIIK